jgi:hypothetical protein
MNLVPSPDQPPQPTGSERPLDRAAPRPAGELLDQLRQRLEALPPNHPSSADLAAAGRDRTVARRERTCAGPEPPAEPEPAAWQQREPGPAEWQQGGLRAAEREPGEPRAAEREPGEPRAAERDQDQPTGEGDESLAQAEPEQGQQPAGAAGPAGDAVAGPGHLRGDDRRLASQPGTGHYRPWFAGDAAAEPWFAAASQAEPWFAGPGAADVDPPGAGPDPAS